MRTGLMLYDGRIAVVCLNFGTQNAIILWEKSLATLNCFGFIW